VNIEEAFLVGESATANLLTSELINEGYDKEFAKRASEFSDAVKLAADSSQEICRVEFSNSDSKYPEKDGERVKMFEFGNNLLIIAEDKDGDKNRVELLEIENHAPCIVKGTNFWEWLWGEGSTAAKNAAKADQHFDLTDITITSDNKMAINPDPITKDLRVDVDLFEDRPMIYKVKIDKAEIGSICLIPEFNDGTLWDGPIDLNSGCDLDTKEDDNGNLRNYVDNDCLNKDNDYLDVQNDDGSLKIPICKVSEPTTGTGGLPISGEDITDIT